MIEIWLVNGLIVGLAAALNLAAHWFPWRVIPPLMNERGMLGRVAAYMYGTLTILGGMALRGWAGEVLGVSVGGWECVRFHALLILGVGLATIFAYVIDGIAEGQAAQGDVEDYETFQG